MKKVVIAVIAVILAIGCIACFTACNKGDQKVDDGAGVTMATKVNYDPDYSILNNVDLTGKTLNVGVIWVGDSTEGYTEAHIEGLNKAAANLRAKGATVNITTKEKIGEDATCQAQAEQLAQNNDLIISNSYSPILGIISANREIQSNDYPIFTIAYLRFIQGNHDHVKPSALHH